MHWCPRPRAIRRSRKAFSGQLHGWSSVADRLVLESMHVQERWLQERFKALILVRRTVRILPDVFNVWRTLRRSLKCRKHHSASSLARHWNDH